MNILIVTSEIGLDGGGMSLACKRVVDILMKEHNVIVLSSTENPIYSVKGVMNPNTENGIRKEYKLKHDSLVYKPDSYTHLRAHETAEHLVCRLLIEKKKYAVF